MPFTFNPLELNGATLVEPKVFNDPRGFFKETFKKSDFAKAGIKDEFVQANYSTSSQHVLRGLHFQKPPMDQAKLVSVVHGTIIDVIVDLRKKSPTFKKWVAVELSTSNHKLLYVPTGFAHGFCVMSERADVHYLINAEYSAEHDGGIHFSDPDINVDWPIKNPLVSDKDKTLPLLNEIDNPF